VALKLQLLARWIPSVAVHVTLVEPTGNAEPLGGAHASVTGDTPPTLLGAP
jgi:hypothetical protein